MIGKTLAHYEITSQLGKGGMGEVYRAKDRKLGRDVAIKVLPEEFARDADRVARFQREAKLLASLNHPNIAAIYGLEESSGTNFLVLELVEGETLADQLKRGSIPIEDALKLALQITEALEAAHEKGVIHRDLKPANIKVTPDGKVKALDFGLAKAFAGEQEQMDLSNSPTLTDAATQQGVILGTAAYMSPEQARGKAVDKRADIWAFGVVLFEMLTGRATFSGQDVTDTLAAVIRAEPEWGSLPPNLHWRLWELIERCLEKDAKNRYRDIGDARADIQKVLTDPGGVFAKPGTMAEPRARLKTIFPWIAAAVLLTAIIAGVAVWKFSPPEPKRVMRFDYELPAGQQFNRNAAGAIDFRLAISPDGNQFVHGTTEGLWIRSIDALDARLLAGTDKDSTQPFFSPDSQWIGYWSQSDRKLKKVAISGGAPVALCDTGLGVLGASWDSVDTIVYSDTISGIMRVSANGGTPQSLMKGSLAALMKEGLPTAPQMLPDGKTLLFTNIVGLDASNSQIVIQSLQFDKGIDSSPIWIPDGKQIVFSSIHGGILGAVCWKSADGIGEAELFGSKPDRAIIPCSFSPDGKILAVLELSISPLGTDIGMLSMEGKREMKELLQGKHMELEPQISPDGRYVAYQSDESGKGETYVRSFPDVNKGKWQVSSGDGGSPLWSPDGRALFYRSGDATMVVEVETEPTFKRGNPKILFRGTYLSNTTQKIVATPWDISRDGKRFLMIKPPASTGAASTAASPQPKITIVVNWLEELKQRVPVK